MSAQDQLQQTLNNQISLSEAFVRALLNEREMIAKNQIDQLPEITQEKLKLVEGLRQKEAALLAILKDNLGDQATKEPRKAIASLDPDGEFQLIELVTKARDLAQQCKRENEINSQIVESSHSQVEQILDLLLGRDKTSVYSADGKTSKHGKGSLGRA